jgi:hypothetical protein
VNNSSVAPLGTSSRVALPNSKRLPSARFSATPFGRAKPPPSSPHGAFFVRSTADVT